MDLAKFLTDRLDEDEAAAREASGGTVVGEAGNWQATRDGDEWEVNAKDPDLELLVALRPGLPRPAEVLGGYWGSVISWQEDCADSDAWRPEPQLRHIARFDPARVLREVDAKRAILAEALAVRKLLDLTGGEEDRYREWVLRQMAAVYSDSEDFDPAWKE